MKIAISYISVLGILPHHITVIKLIGQQQPWSLSISNLIPYQHPTKYTTTIYHPTMSSFPLYAKVVLQGLQKAPELNGKEAVVQSALSETGRQQVYIASLSKTVNIKPANLLYQDRPVDSLSVKELKRVLEATQEKAENTNETDKKDETPAPVDKSELQAQVAKLTDSPQEIAEILAIAEAKEEEAAAAKKPKKKSTRSTSNNANSNNNPQHVANAMENMSPEQLRQQAHMLRTMNPNVLRAQNPQLAHMTDAQIRQAAQQFEMMASNPALRKQALDQMKHMSPEQMAAMGGGPAARGPPQNPAEAMANMTPEQMRQQAHMLKTMDPDTIRRTNPQLAHMSNDQIKQAAAQFEMMANNPDMMKMAMDQMKNMTPEQMEAVQRGEMPPPDDSAAAADPATMLANMDKKQLKQMLRTVKDNPDMIKQFAKMTGSSEEATQKSLEAFANMDDAKLDMAVTALSFVQKLQQWWKSTSTTHKLLTVGGIGFTILAGIYALVALVIYMRSSSSSGDAAASVKDDAAAAEPVPVVEDEFGEL